jgi:hypothetical protein
VGCEQFFADVSSKIIALANPVLSQPDMEREMVSPPPGAYIPSFTIYDVLPDLPGGSGVVAHLATKLCRMYRDVSRSSGTPGMHITVVEGRGTHLSTSSTNTNS